MLFSVLSSAKMLESQGEKWAGVGSSAGTKAEEEVARAEHEVAGERPKRQVPDAAAEAAGTGGWEGTERLPKPRQEERTSTDATTYLHTPLTFHLLVLVSACPTEHTRHLIMLQVEILPAFKDLLKYNLFRLKPFFSLTGYDFLWRLIIF